MRSGKKRKGCRKIQRRVVAQIEKKHEGRKTIRVAETNEGGAMIGLH